MWLKVHPPSCTRGVVNLTPTPCVVWAMHPLMAWLWKVHSWGGRTGQTPAPAHSLQWRGCRCTQAPNAQWFGRCNHLDVVAVLGALLHWRPLPPPALTHSNGVVVVGALTPMLWFCSCTHPYVVVALTHVVVALTHVVVALTHVGVALTPMLWLHSPMLGLHSPLCWGCTHPYVVVALTPMVWLHSPRCRDCSRCTPGTR